MGGVIYSISDSISNADFSIDDVREDIIQNV